MTEPIYDVITLGDFRLPACRSNATIEQLRATVDAGYRTAIVQLKSVLIDKPAPFHPRIRSLLDQREIDLLDPDLPARARLVLADHPRLFTFRPRRVLQLDAEERLVLVREAPRDALGNLLYDWPRISRQATEIMGGAVIWAPGSPMVRDQLADLDPRPRLAKSDWPAILESAPWRRPRDGYCTSRPVIGRHGWPTADSWPDDRDELLLAYPDDPQILVRLLGEGEILRRIVGPYPRNWQVLTEGEVSAEAFLGTIDFFVYCHHRNRIGLTDSSILEAMASGVVTILPPAFQPLYGDGAVYAEPHQIKAVVQRLYANRKAYLEQSRLGMEMVDVRFAPGRHVDRIRELIGPSEPGSVGPAPVRHHPRAKPARRRRRVLFITINGVGMGHLTRMLAIARRCPAPIEPVFLTMSQALKVVRDQGFLAEYVPSRKYLDCDLNRWNGFLRDEINELIAFYDPAVVLFDGNVPYQGMVDAIKANPDPWFVWSRRGMWRAGNADIVDRERFFDVVLEPGDLADSFDHGITTRHREKTRGVSPIRLLDPSEMLSRDEARRELDLSNDRPAVLIQLGAGNNYNYRSIHKTAFAHVTRHHNAQVAVGEWLISEQSIDLPETVVRLPGYPFARYFHAFDLAISAVGYNSFHELLYAGVPTVLVPNEAMEQDNQLARALYADHHGLAACVRTKEIYSLGTRIDQLFEPTARQRVKQRLAALDTANGAAEAAAFIEEMVCSRRVDRENGPASP